jgi:hypothetical protein
MKYLIITIIGLCLVISCSTSKLIVDNQEIKNLNSNIEKINCIVHNYFANRNSNHWFRKNYNFSLVVKYTNFDKNEYLLYLTAEFDFKDIETISLINHLKKSEIFNNSLKELKEEKNTLRIVGDTVYSIINIKSLNRRELKSYSTKNHQ